MIYLKLKSSLQAIGSSHLFDKILFNEVFNGTESLLFYGDFKLSSCHYAFRLKTQNIVCTSAGQRLFTNSHCGGYSYITLSHFMLTEEGELLRWPTINQPLAFYFKHILPILFYFAVTPVLKDLSLIYSSHMPQVMPCDYLRFLRLLSFYSL